MARLRANTQAGWITAQVDTTAGMVLMPSDGLASFPALAYTGVDYYPATLDPDGENGSPEIIAILAHPGSPLATPGAPTVGQGGAAGTTSYAYRVSALNGLGETLASVEATTVTGNAALSTSNFNIVSWTAVPGASSYNVYGRTAGAELKLVNTSGTSYSDTGAATPAGVLPVVSTATPAFATIMGHRETSLTGRVHLVGEDWVHGPTVADFGVIKDVAWTRLVGGHPADDEFNTGVLDPAWVQLVPSGSQSVIVGGDVCSVKVAGQGGGSMCVLLKPIPLGFTHGSKIETAVRRMYIDSYIMAGLMLTDGISAGSNCMFQMPYAGNLGTRSGTIGAMGTDYGTFGVGNFGASALLYQRMTWVGANSYQTEWSLDGVQWTTFGRGPFGFTMTPTYMGFAQSTWSGGNEALASWEYFRVTI